MLTLIMWHNRFSKNENEAVEAHIPQHRDSKTKKPRHRILTLMPPDIKSRLKPSAGYQDPQPDIKILGREFQMCGRTSEIQIPDMM